ncbi:MAG: hypothetical protein K2G60_03140 [Oscillospiraceae bacterium]|nr:hypothetical protein [Oscillospiraceae bacterium]
MANNSNNLTYTQKKQLLQQSIMQNVNGGKYNPALIRQYGECAYRLDIFDNFNVLNVTAPISTDSQTLNSHWGFVTRVLIALTKERMPANLTAEQSTAYANFTKIIESNMNVLANFQPQQYPADTYRNAVIQILQTSYDAFIAFRNTIIKC